jgi:hypothetical protein
MHQVIEGFANACAIQPDAVLTVARIGSRWPAAPGDLPSLTLAVDVERVLGAGVGRFEREATIVTAHTNVIVVADAAPFDTGRHALALDPLPVRRNPTSTSPKFSGSDLRVRNVTTAQPAEYRFVSRPAAVDEFAFDRYRGRVLFGAAQPVGDTLEVTHYTLDLRDDITTQHFAGTLRILVWAAQATEAESISRALQTRASVGRALFRQRGFLRLSAARLDVLEHVVITPAVGSAFPAWRQAIAYGFAFEAAEGGTESAGGRIHRIDVGLEGDVEEVFALP